MAKGNTWYKQKLAKYRVQARENARVEAFKLFLEYVDQKARGAIDLRTIAPSDGVMVRHAKAGKARGLHKDIGCIGKGGRRAFKRTYGDGTRKWLSARGAWSDDTSCVLIPAERANGKRWPDRVVAW